MSFLVSESAASWLEWLREAESALDALASDDDYGLYQWLHYRANCLAPVDACYVCLYRADDDALFFSYNFDAGLYDEPLTVPLGTGPTSWVVRNGASFVLDESTWDVHNGNVNFGDGDNISRSALHLPLRLQGQNGEGDELLGVFSIQSYQSDAYTPTLLSALQLLCERASHWMQRKRERLQWTAQLDAVTLQSQEDEAHKIRMANHFVEMLQPVTRQAQTLLQSCSQEAPPSMLELRAQLRELCQMCFRLQTKTSQLPIASRPTAAKSSVVSPSRKDESNPLHKLTPREVEVLQLMATGATNAEIALALGRGRETAKKHCSNIFKKFEVKNRPAALQIYYRYVGDAKIILSGNKK